jgi:hypothetical protein
MQLMIFAKESSDHNGMVKVSFKIHKTNGAIKISVCSYSSMSCMALFLGSAWCSCWKISLPLAWLSLFVNILTL